MGKRSRSNPLALAVLECLFERPMHPYAISQTLRTRGKHESIKLNYGSLYTVVEGLAKRGLIEAQETAREGRRPERTVYALTEAGRVEFTDWLSELVSTPTKEYTQFEAALSLIGGLPPDDVVSLLRQRVEALEWLDAQESAVREHAVKVGLPRLFWVEAEYRSALRAAEREFARALADDIEHGVVEGVDVWRRWHEDPDFDAPAFVRELMRKQE
jgi:DNA-binding PadR family transcriptional regulator